MKKYDCRSYAKIVKHMGNGTPIILLFINKNINTEKIEERRVNGTTEISKRIILSL